MTVSPVSYTSMVQSLQGVESQPTSKPDKATPAQQPADSVTLSAAAQGKLKSGDIDHDGDSH